MVKYMKNSSGDMRIYESPGAGSKQSFGKAAASEEAKRTLSGTLSL